MVKEKRILSYFIGWLVLGFIVCFLGITKIYAAEQKTGLGFLNNSTVYISNNKGADIQLTRQTANNVSMDIRSIVFSSNYNFQANTVYDYEIQITGQYLRNVDKATILSNNGICTLIGLSGLNTEYTKVRFTCSSATSSITIGLSNSNDNNITNGYNINWQSIYLWSITDTIDLGPIINNQSQNTQDILNNDNQNTNNIIDNNNQNTQDIINSNKETQDVIKDQFNSCRPSVNLFNYNDLVKGRLDSGVLGYSSGTDSITVYDDSFSYTTNTNYRGVVSGYISVKPNNKYTFNTSIVNNGVIQFAYYDNNKNFIQQFTLTKALDTYTIPNNVYFVRIYYSLNYAGTTTIIKAQFQEGTIATTFEPAGDICTNKLDEQNDKLNGIQGALTDSSAPNTSGLENSAGWLPAGPLDSILNLPLTMLNSLTNSLNKTCSPLNLTLPYVNKQLQIPCLSSIFAKITGVNGLWTWVGTIASVLILYNYLLNLYAWVDRVLTLRAEFDEAMGADLANWGRL